MTNHTIINFNRQEYFGWIGNLIFISAQISQIFYTYKVKRTNDISYTLQFLLLIGNIMYTIFGYIDFSLSMFLGNSITLFTSVIQISQKAYYDKKNKDYEELMPINF